ncbi:sulfurtransferase TusA family protein [Streptomyces fildesensis]|uniref:sulfurtransferase TusA family protein n=1 Tax=Streptomyces fildesensis TaxID=375757 RepID=UPI0027DC2176|nr:sulfurtransferase TusA family protein [Streptomyces fildesensis]
MEGELPRRLGVSPRACREAAAPVPATDLTVDGTGLLCVVLRLCDHIQDAQPVHVVHVIATDPAAPLDLPAWCHTTGHTCLGPVLADDQPVYALRLTADARRTRADAPWHPAAADH